MSTATTSADSGSRYPSCSSTASATVPLSRSPSSEPHAASTDAATRPRASRRLTEPKVAPLVESAALVLHNEERLSRRKEIVSRLYNEGWAHGDFDLVFALLDPKVVWTAIEGAPDAGTYMGLESVRRYMQDWLDDFHFQGGGLSIEESIEIG